MNDQDQAVSHQEMRKALYFRQYLITSLDATDEECARALRTVPDIDRIEVLHRTVGSDGMWAAKQVLEVL